MVSRIFTSVIACLIIFSSYQYTHSQDTVRVMAYNILRYGANGVGGCTPIGVTARNQWFTDVLSETKPDIFGVNEIAPTDGAFSPAANISLNVLPNVPDKGPHYEATQINFDGNQDICNMMYYNSQKVGLSTQAFINVSGTARNLDYYKFYYKSAEPIMDSAFIHVILVHFMASSAAARENQATAAMNFLDNSLGGAQDNYIIMGDMNLSSGATTAYQIMANHSNVDVRMRDPLNLTSWNQNYVYTQSTTPSTGDCRAGGGLNDRFDIILCSNALINNSLGMSYVSGSYWSVGNPHSPNPQLSTAGQIGINGMSDHHPVLMDIAVSQAVANDGRLDSPVSLKVVSPFGEELSAQVTIPAGWESEYVVKITDLQGRVQYEQKDYLGTGVHQLAPDVSGLSNGIYFLSLESESLPVIAKIVRMK